MTVESRWTNALVMLREKLARLSGWVVTCEHELIILERSFSTMLLHGSSIPYLDFLRGENIRCNPCSFYTAVISQIQGSTAERSSLLDSAIASSLLTIGVAYGNRISRERIHELAFNDVQSFAFCHIKQSLDFRYNHFSYGRPFEAEAAFAISEELIRLASPELSRMLGIYYEKYTLENLGEGRATKVWYDAGLSEYEVVIRLGEHWNAYCVTTNLESIDRETDIVSSL